MVANILIATVYSMAVTLYLARKTSFLSLGPFFSLICTMNLLTFWFIGVYGRNFKLFSTMYWDKTNLFAHANFVSFFMCFLSTLPLIGALLASKKVPGTNENAPSEQFALASVYAESTKLIGNIIDHPLVLIFSLISLSLIYLHATDIEWKLVYLHFEYLQISYAQDAGITGAFATFFHSIKWLIGLFASILLPVAIRHRKILTSIMLLCISSYVLLHAVALESRFGFVQVVAIAAMLQATREKRGIDPYAVVVAILAFGLLILALEMRRQPLHGLYAIYLGFKLSGLTFMDGLIMAVTSLFSGGLVLAIADGAYAEYPTMYKVLTILPTLSSLDGFNQIRDAAEVRIDWYVPMSTFAEINLFGPIYQILFYGFLILLFKIAHEIWQSRGAVSSYIILAPAYLALPQSFMYQARPMIRMLLIAYILALLVKALPLIRELAFPSK